MEMVTDQCKWATEVRESVNHRIYRNVLAQRGKINRPKNGYKKTSTRPHGNSEFHAVTSTPLLLSHHANTHRLLRSSAGFTLLAEGARRRKCGASSRLFG